MAQHGSAPDSAGRAAAPLPAGVTEQSLRVAVEAARSWRGVLRSLALSSPRDGRRFQQACDAWGIDYSHFGSRTWTDAELRQALSTARAWPELMQALGYREDSGSARATIRKHAARLHLDVARFAARPSLDAADPFAGTPDPAHLRYAGAYLVAGACALLGHRVSWPLEPAAYDLLVDTGRIQRVQVKTTTSRQDGEWACKVTRLAAGGKGWYTADDIDYFGVVDGDLQVYMIPVDVLAGLGTIVVRRYDAFRLSPPTSALRPDPGPRIG